MAGQDKNMNNTSVLKTKTLNITKPCRLQFKINKTKKFSDPINYTVLADILLKMDNTEKEKVHIKTLNKCINQPTFSIIFFF